MFLVEKLTLLVLISSEEISSTSVLTGLTLNLVGNNKGKNSC